jgi:hypothetical protein
VPRGGGGGGAQEHAAATRMEAVPITIAANATTSLPNGCMPVVSDDMLPAFSVDSRYVSLGEVCQCRTGKSCEAPLSSV